MEASGRPNVKRKSREAQACNQSLGETEQISLVLKCAGVTQLCWCGIGPSKLYAQRSAIIYLTNHYAKDCFTRSELLLPAV
jgi:hypothetical protein